MLADVKKVGYRMKTELVKLFSRASVFVFGIRWGTRGFTLIHIVALD